MLTPTDVQAHTDLGISPEMLKRAQVQRVSDYEARDLLAMHGWPATQKLDGVLYPYFAPQNGHVTTRRLRRDHPEIENGKPKNKYLSGYGDHKHLYFPPECKTLLSDISAVVVIAEAEKSVLSIVCAAEKVGRKVLAIGTGGCWGWRGVTGKTEDASGTRVDEKGPLPDLHLVTWTGRTVVIAFDANAATNPNVQTARTALARELSARGAIVRVLDLPTEPGINGPDDYIGQRGPHAFFTLLDKAGTAIAGLVIRKATDVPDERLEKIFGGRLVRGAFALLVGPGEAGKGMFSVDVLARITTGEPFPGEMHKRAPGNVLVCVTEDSMGRVKSRLRAAGADLDRVLFAEGPEVSVGGLLMPTPMMLHDDAGALVRFAKEMNARGLFLETVVEHFGDRAGKTRHNTNTEAEVRRALSPFRAVCHEAKLFGWGAVHPRKSTDGGVNDSISGSAAFRNVARATHHVYPDPEDESDTPVRLLFTGKANYLARRPPTLRFRIRSWDEGIASPCQCPTADCGHEGRIVWEDDLEDERTAEEIWHQIAERNKPRRDVAVEQAEEFLQRVLDGRMLPPDEIVQLAKKELITPAALKRAKAKLGIVSVKQGFPATVVGWQLKKVDSEM
jgi:hypothetical protein